MRFTDNKFIFLAFFLLSIIFFWKIVVNPLNLLFSDNSDIVLAFAYFEHFAVNSIYTYGQLPLWNSFVFGGYPFIGNFLAALFYPLNLLFFVFPTDAVFGWLALIHVFLSGSFMFLFARKINLSKSASFLAAIIFMFAAKTILTIYAGHTIIFEAIALLPLAFYALECLLQKQNLLNSIFLGISLSLILFAGFIQGFAYSFFVLVIYALFRLCQLRKQKNNLKLIGLLVIAVAVCFGLIAVQFLPPLEYVQYSNRFGSTGELNYGFAANFSLPLENAITFAIPDFFGSPLNNSYVGPGDYWTLAIYFGVLSLILVFVALFFKFKDWKVRFFIGMSLFTLLFAFGKYLHFFDLFYYFVPGFSMFRGPARMLSFFVFFISLVSGFGFEFLLKEKLESKKFKWFLIFLVIILLISVALTGFVLTQKGFVLNIGEKIVSLKYAGAQHSNDISFWLSKVPGVYNSISSGLIAFCVFLLASVFLLFAWLKKLLSKKLFVLGVILLILCDLWFFGFKFIDTKNPTEIFIESNEIKFLELDKSVFRILDFKEIIPQYLAERYGIQKLTGYDPLLIGSYLDLLSLIKNDTNNEINNHALLNFLNAKYIVSKIELNDSSLKLVFKDSLFIYENQDVLPRAFVVGKVINLSNDVLVLESLKNSNFNAKETAFISTNDVLPEINSDFKEANITFYSSNKVSLEVTLEKPGFLVLSDNYYPGWDALDNGLEKKIYLANHSFRGIFLESGVHKIDFVFTSAPFQVGAIISLFSLIIIICGLIWIFFKKKH